MTTKKIIITFSVSIIASISLIFILYAFAEKPNSKKNGFNRSLKGTKLELVKELDLQYPGYYFAGFRGDTAYLGNGSAALHLLKVDLMNFDTVSLALKLGYGAKLSKRGSKIHVDYPFVYCMDGRIPSYLKADVRTLELGQYIRNVEYFNSTQQISNSTFINRGVSSQNQNNILFKINDKQPNAIKYSYDLEKQVDGIFCTEGTLIYDNITSKAVYLYRYRNQYLVFDSSLNLLDKGNTIDTNTTAKIEVADVKGGKRIFSAPKTVVNLTATASAGRLYVLSPLLADNEKVKISDHFKTVDVYDYANLSYLYSFYIQTPNKIMASELKIYSDRLVVISGEKMLIYRLG